MLLCAFVFITTGLLAMAATNRCQHNTNQEDTAYNQNQMETIDSISFKKDSLKNLMIDEAQNFINSKAPKAHKDIPQLLVDNALEHNIDIAFIMAQAHYETNFGTAGAGKPNSRYSLFGVNGKFKNYEDAIDKYISLLQDKYLTNGRTEQHLMKNYVNNTGHRYATSTSYESKLKKYYKGIITTSNIRDIQIEYNNLG